MLGWFPENISTYGGEIDSVFRLIYWIVGIWFVVAESAILFFVLRYRRRPERRAVYVRGDRWSELAWILVPTAIILVLDLGIDAASGPAWAHVKEQSPPGGVSVRVTAKQFNWEFTYPGPDGKFDTADDMTIDNALHVPVGQNVHLTLQSRDVIHSFFIPTVRLKQDVLPGRKINAWFNAIKTGEFEIPCAELCGFGHSGMLGALTVHTADDYQRWVNERWPTDSTSASSATTN